MKKTVLIGVFLILLVSSVYATTYTQTQLYFLIKGKFFYLVPEIFIEDILDKGDSEPIVVKIWSQHSDYPSTYSETLVLLDGVNVTGSITKPDLSIENITFADDGSGEYSYTYTFSDRGTYKISIEAKKTSYGTTKAYAYVYVGRYPISAEVFSETRYNTNSTGEIDVFVKDDEENPILGGSGTVTIKYPDKTTWVTGNLIEISNGQYYYNFTTPTIEGKYTAFVNFSSSGNNAYASTSFDVGGWADTITDINETVDDINETVSDINETVDDINETVNTINDSITQLRISSVELETSNTLGEANKVWVTIENGMGDAFDPTTIQIDIYDSSLTNVVNNASMTKYEDGLYYKSFTINDNRAVGNYIIIVRADYGTLNAKKTKIFKISSADTGPGGGILLSEKMLIYPESFSLNSTRQTISVDITNTDNFYSYVSIVPDVSLAEIVNIDVFKQKILAKEKKTFDIDVFPLENESYSGSLIVTYEQTGQSVEIPITINPILDRSNLTQQNVSEKITSMFSKTFEGSLNYSICFAKPIGNVKGVPSGLIIILLVYLLFKSYNSLENEEQKKSITKIVYLILLFLIIFIISNVFSKTC